MAYRTIGIDRILEVATGPGTGVVTLGGAVAGFRTFASVLAAADTCAYFIEAVNEWGAPTGLWERGFGTLTAATTFARSFVLESTNGLSALANFTGAVRIGVAPLTETTAAQPVPGGRLSATTAPVSDSAGTTATLYYVPYTHDRITLWNGAALQQVQIPVSIGLALTNATFGLGYDVFAVISGATMTIEMLAWSSNAVRATGLTYQNGFLCKAGDPLRRYLGSFLSNGGNTYDMANIGGSGNNNAPPAKRFIWNMYNRRPRPAYMADTTNSWTYGTGTNLPWRIAGNQASPNATIEVFRGLDQDAVLVTGSISGTTPAGAYYYTTVGVNGAVPAHAVSTCLSSAIGTCTSAYSGLPGLGYITFNLMELANTANSTLGAAWGTPGLNALLYG